MNTNRATKTLNIAKRFTTILFVGLAVFAAAWLTSSGATVSRAAVLILVNSTGDGANIATAPNCDADPVPGNQCTLRAAIEAANASPGADVIAFGIPASEPGCSSSGQCAIYLTGPLPRIAEAVEINGPGASSLTVRRNTGGDYRIFDITAIGTVAISAMTIENGFSTPTNCCGTNISGGAIHTESADLLNITSCIIRDTKGPGAAISSNYPSQPPIRELNITDSMIVDNERYGIFSMAPDTTIVGSTISRNGSTGLVSAVTNVVNSTISHNAGGGIFNNGQIAANLQVTNSTITRNYVVDNQGPCSNCYAPIGINSSVTLKSSIVADNYSLNPNSPDIDINNGVSLGYNVIGTVSGTSFAPAATDQVGVTPAQADLGPLQDNGGPTHTIALGCASVAIDAGFAGTLTTDQRGAGFPRVFGPSADVGAFESGACNTPPSIISTPILRSRGSAARAVIANVSDLEDPEETLVVTANNSDVAQVNGVKVSAIAVSPTGEVTALIDIACNAEIAEFDLMVTDSGGLTDQATFLVRLEGICNTAPSISSTPMHRPRGSSGNFAIATVSDAEDAENTLLITLNAGPSVNINGVSVSNLRVDPSGIVTADIAVSCGASQIMPALGVTDSGGLTTYTTLDILVDSSSPPVITLNPSRPLLIHGGGYRIFTVDEMVESATDDCNGNMAGAVVIEKATSDEADNLPGNSDGNTVNDIVIGPNCKTALLRSERSTGGNGRVYSVTLKVTDTDGQTTRAEYKVAVPVSIFGPPAVEGGTQQTVLGGCT